VATDDLPAVPMPHLIGLRSIYWPGQPTSASGIAKVARLKPTASTPLCC